MNNKIDQIISIYGRAPLNASHTVLSILANAARKFAEDPGIPVREWRATWGFVLSSCMLDVSNDQELNDTVDLYTNIYPPKLMSLYGTLPYIFDCFRCLKNYSSDPANCKRNIAAISIAALLSMEEK